MAFQHKKEVRSRITVNTVNPPVPIKATKKQAAADGIRTFNVVIEQQNGSLGFELSANSPPHVVANVRPGSHAAANGLKDGDILAFIGNTDVQRMTQEELLDFLVVSTADGRKAKALIFRNGSRFRVRSAPPTHAPFQRTSKTLSMAHSP